MLFIAIGVSSAAAFQLKDEADYEVKRDLLEASYPAYKAFHGSMHAGLMPADLPDDANASDDFSSYFFWLFQPDVESSDANFRDDTLLIWFNGGPGCSSFVGLMGEMGPIGIPKFGPGIPAPNPATVLDAPLVENPFAWTKKSAMLFVEQPGGTGFSTASSEWTGEEAEERTEDDVASAFYAFLNNMYTVFGKELTNKKIYLTGESYAGMYIPSIARGIHIQNKRLRSNDGEYDSASLHFINLCGAAIGNGWIDAKVQGPAAIDYAWWHGMIDLQTYRGLHQKWDQCMAQEIPDSAHEPFHPFTTPDECGITDAVMKASGSTFMYDVTTFDAYPSVLDEDGTIAKFFNDPVVRESLNAPSISEHRQWRSCVPGSGRRRLLSAHNAKRELILLDNDRPLTVVPYIAELLDDAKLDILLYNGDLDLACSSQSTELALESMEWSGKENWMDPDAAKWYQWTVDNQASGHVKKFDNLQFLVVYNSGHFVPINQAQNALDMIGRLLDGKSLGDKELPMFPIQETKGTQLEPQNGLSTEYGKANQGHSGSFLLAFCGFLLGVLTSQIVFKHSASHKLRTSSSSSSFRTTETTPLHHSAA